jgi:hypothetical protein
MKTKNLLFMTLFLLIGTTMNSFAQCTNCIDSSNTITNNGNSTFTANNAQAYFWEIENCDGNASILGSNTNQTVTVNCNNTGSVKVKVTRFLNGNCIEACEVFNCPNPNSCGVEIGGIGELNLLGDGNLVFIANTTVSSGWNIQNINFQLTYENGTVTNYNGFVGAAGVPQTSTIFVDCDNKVFSATVTITASNGTTTCSDTRTHRFRGGVCGTEGYFSGLKVYPNPTKSKVIFEGLSKNSNHTIRILNSKGELLLTSKNSIREIDLSKQKPGIYFYNVSDEKGNIKTGKIILK